MCPGEMVDESGTTVHNEVQWRSLRPAQQLGSSLIMLGDCCPGGRFLNVDGGISTVFKKVYCLVHYGMAPKVPTRWWNVGCILWSSFNMPNLNSYLRFCFEINRIFVLQTSVLWPKQQTDECIIQMMGARRQQFVYCFGHRTQVGWRKDAADFKTKSRIGAPIGRFLRCRKMQYASCIFLRWFCGFRWCPETF